ncbi:TIM barrel protein [Pseudomonas fulva]|nr:TIM barrel protein [Pseudomonas fulva]MBF8781356.1 TIM barrel protein [Pseudomonas fulva]
MIKLNAHLGYQFTELPFLDRFAAAAAAGFAAVEFPAPYDHAPELISEQLALHNLALIQIAAPMGIPGEKGFAACPGRTMEFRASIQRAIDYALALDCASIHLMSGARPEGQPSFCQWRSYVDNVHWAACALADHAITPLVEVISKTTVAGYFMSSYELFDALLETAPNAGIKLLFDTYHAHLIDGNVIDSFSQAFANIGHIQIADAPGRHEPGTGNLDFPAFFALLQQLGYSGWVGCEYLPEHTTQAGLQYLSSYLPPA